MLVFNRPRGPFLGRICGVVEVRQVDQRQLLDSLGSEPFGGPLHCLNCFVPRCRPELISPESISVYQSETDLLGAANEFMRVKETIERTPHNRVQVAAYLDTSFSEVNVKQTRNVMKISEAPRAFIVACRAEFAGSIVLGSPCQLTLWTACGLCVDRFCSLE